jgi:hypothetical protein
MHVWKFLGFLAAYIIVVAAFCVAGLVLNYVIEPVFVAAFLGLLLAAGGALVMLSAGNLNRTSGVGSISRPRSTIGPRLKAVARTASLTVEGTGARRAGCRARTDAGSAIGREATAGHRSRSVRTAGERHRLRRGPRWASTR